MGTVVRTDAGCNAEYLLLLAAQFSCILAVLELFIPQYDPTRRFDLHNGYTLAALLPDLYCDGDDKCVFHKGLNVAAA